LQKNSTLRLDHSKPDKNNSTILTPLILADSQKNRA
jgi:hypothetical protein